MIAQLFSTPIVTPDSRAIDPRLDSWLTLIWVALPLVVGFSVYLLPRVARTLAIIVPVLSLAYGLWRLLGPTDLSLQLLDSFGVTLLADRASGYLIVTNALVTLAVILYCWTTGKSAFFYTQLIVLHGSVNAVFICADLISLYVALEVISIGAFLLIAYPRTNRSIWVALRYLFIGNTVMLFYLIGVVLVYQANHSFAYGALANSPPEAIALICLGLLTKGGVFISGLWLPMTHSQADTPISALLSGIVIKTGVFPLVRLMLLVPDLQPILQPFSVATAILGVVGAILATDVKRLLAFSTISQMGFVLSAPAMAGFYALTHGLAKASLFLCTSKLPSRDLRQLAQTPIPVSLWVALTVPSLSISGFPLLAGFEAKTLTLKALADWPGLLMTGAAVGTAIVFARLIFLPRSLTPSLAPSPVPSLSTGPGTEPNASPEQPRGISGFWLAIIVLVSGLGLANQFQGEVYQVANLGKALITIALGWIVHWLLKGPSRWQLPSAPEHLEHLVGTMAIVLVVLFWMVII